MPGLLGESKTNEEWKKRSHKGNGGCTDTDWGNIVHLGNEVL